MLPPTAVGGRRTSVLIREVFLSLLLPELVLSVDTPFSPALLSLPSSLSPASPVVPMEQAGPVLWLQLPPLPLPVPTALRLLCLLVLRRSDRGRRCGVAGRAVPGAVSSPAGVWLCSEDSIPVPVGAVYLGGLGWSLVACPPHADTLRSRRGSSPEVGWGPSDRLPATLPGGTSGACL